MMTGGDSVDGERNRQSDVSKSLRHVTAARQPERRSAAQARTGG
jgi:hypothetical protein